MIAHLGIIYRSGVPQMASQTDSDVILGGSNLKTFIYELLICEHDSRRTNRLVIPTSNISYHIQMLTCIPCGVLINRPRRRPAVYPFPGGPACWRPPRPIDWAQLRRSGSLTRGTVLRRVQRPNGAHAASNLPHHERSAARLPPAGSPPPFEQSPPGV